VFIRTARYLEEADADASELLAEAYVLNVGKYLSGFEDAVFAQLGEIVVDDEEILDPEQWSWVDQQRHILG
jgi:hypothetical protein